MPSRINVIRLDESEKEVLRQVSARDEIKDVTKAVGAALRTPNADAVSIAGAAETDINGYRALAQSLEHRMRLLDALPIDEAVKGPLVERTGRALSIAREAVQMLDAS